MTATRALALGHVRNAVWQLLSSDDTRTLTLGMECLDLEALLNPDDLEPDLAPLQPDAAASLTSARLLLESTIEAVTPAAWAVLQSLRTKLG